jgi:DNA-directed RNA polymerase specialized sigma24 family protein
MPALASESRLEDLLAVDEALTRLEAAAPLVARIVECRVFAGMTIDETAEVLELSPPTVKRHWTTARAWLNRDLSTEARRDG